MQLRQACGSEHSRGEVGEFEEADYVFNFLDFLLCFDFFRERVDQQPVAVLLVLGQKV